MVVKIKQLVVTISYK